jgi:arylsulfatase A-like enzyme
MAEARHLTSVRSLILALPLLLSLAGCRDHPVPPRLLLLISVDTLRADRLGSYGSDLDLTPNLDALAAQSQVFEWAFAPTSFTLPSVSSLLTGRQPEEIGVLGNRSALGPAVPTLASALRARGWRSAAVVSNLVLRRNCGLAAGFDVYDDLLPDREATRKWPERIAADTSDAALAILDGFPSEGGERLFLWVHYQDPHGPYTPPEGLREHYLAAERARPDGRRQLPEATGRGGRGRIPTYQVVGENREVAFYRAGYDAEVHYLDAEVGRLLRALTERGLSDATLVVFTADHGESLGERDYWFAHGERLGDPLVRVPLLLRVPGLPPRRRSDVAGLVDLFPTLLHYLAGLPTDPEAPGRDLLAPEATTRDSVPYLATLGDGHTPRFGIVADGHKFVLTKRDDGWHGELFRLGHEDLELSRSEPERARHLRERLADLRANLRRGHHEARQRLSEEDRRNLQALGYIEESEPPEIR